MEKEGGREGGKEGTSYLVSAVDGFGLGRAVEVSEAVNAEGNIDPECGGVYLPHGEVHAHLRGRKGGREGGREGGVGRRICMRKEGHT